VVEMSVKVSDLAYYSESAKGWVVDSDTFVFHLGSSSKDIRQSVSISVK